MSQHRHAIDQNLEHHMVVERCDLDAEMRDEA